MFFVIYLFIYLFIYFGHTAQHAGCDILVPAQGLNPHPLQCKCRVLTTDLQGSPWGDVLNADSQAPPKVKSLSRVWLFATPWTVASQAPLSMGFSRQEFWSGLPFPSPGDLPNPGIEPQSPALQADALSSEPPGKPHLRLPQSESLKIGPRTWILPRSPSWSSQRWILDHPFPSYGRKDSWCWTTQV